MDKAEQPTITQADREAAEAVYPAFLASLRGEDGGYRLAEAFARHRTTSLAAQDGLVEALEDAVAFMAGDISGSTQRDGIIKQAKAALSAIKEQHHD